MRSMNISITPIGYDFGYNNNVYPIARDKVKTLMEDLENFVNSFPKTEDAFTGEELPLHVFDEKRLFVHDLFPFSKLSNDDAGGLYAILKDFEEGVDVHGDAYISLLYKRDGNHPIC